VRDAATVTTNNFQASGTRQRAAAPGTRFEPAASQRELFAVRSASVAAAAVLDAGRCAGAVERVNELVDRAHVLLQRS
jgi:hypothetical protein